MITTSLCSPIGTERCRSTISATQVLMDGRAALIVRRIYRGIALLVCHRRKHQKKVKNKSRG